MANTTRRRNTTSRSKGRSGKRSRSRKSGSSNAGGFFLFVLLIALCGAGYYFYKNGIPSNWNLFDIDKEKVVASEIEQESPAKVMKRPQKAVPNKVRQEEKKSTREKSAVQQPVTKKDSLKKSVAQQPSKQQKVVVKQDKQQKASKFISPSYKTYSQGRWGYSVVYPSFLNRVFRSENNDGCRFADDDGTEFITYGSWNVTDASIRELYREKLDDNMKVTYKRLYKAENYFIKFGYTKDGRMFYMKQVIADKLKDSPIITGILYFRPESKKGSEEVIQKIFGKFPY